MRLQRSMERVSLSFIPLFRSTCSCYWLSLSIYWYAHTGFLWGIWNLFLIFSATLLHFQTRKAFCFLIYSLQCLALSLHCFGRVRGIKILVCWVYLTRSTATHTIADDFDRDLVYAQSVHDPLFSGSMSPYDYRIPPTRRNQAEASSVPKPAARVNVSKSNNTHCQLDI